MKSITIKTTLLLTLVVLLCCLSLFKVPFARAQDDATSSAPVDAATSSAADAGESGVTAVAPESTSTALTPAESTSTTTSADATPSVAQDTTSTPPANQNAPTGLKLVHIIGTKYVDSFTDGTTVTSYPGDADIDANLGKPNASIPTHDGLTWVQTTTQYLYDTPSGDLDMGDYAVQPIGTYVANPYPVVSSTSSPQEMTPTSNGTSTNAVQPPTPATASDTPPTPLDSNSSGDATTSSN
jgi:hypothetical protein